MLEEFLGRQILAWFFLGLTKSAHGIVSYISNNNVSILMLFGTPFFMQREKGLGSDKTWGRPWCRPWPILWPTGSQFHKTIYS